jgi:hypothetical protein
MPTDLHDGIDDWFVPGATPGGADYPDDWYVPTAARADTSYPDDWYVPTPAASPVTAQSVPDAQLAAANPSIRNQATPRPDPFAAYWSLIPASRAGATAWHPPIFPNSLGRFPLTAPAPASAPPIDATGSLLGGGSEPAGNKHRPGARPPRRYRGSAMGESGRIPVVPTDRICARQW